AKAITATAAATEAIPTASITAAAATTEAIAAAEAAATACIATVTLVTEAVALVPAAARTALTSIETHALQFFPNLAPSIERSLRRALAQPPSGVQNQPRQKKDIKQMGPVCERFCYIPRSAGAAIRGKAPPNRKCYRDF
ncbi:hypothetical protein WP12_01740, partial [Sphingomonas sp. SRS2]